MQGFGNTTLQSNFGLQSGLQNRHAFTPVPPACCSFLTHLMSPIRRWHHAHPASACICLASEPLCNWHICAELRPDMTVVQAPAGAASVGSRPRQPSSRREGAAGSEAWAASFRCFSTLRALQEQPLPRLEMSIQYAFPVGQTVLLMCYHALSLPCSPRVICLHTVCVPSWIRVMDVATLYDMVGIYFQMGQAGARGGGMANPQLGGLMNGLGGLGGGGGGGGQNVANRCRLTPTPAPTLIHNPKRAPRQLPLTKKCPRDLPSNLLPHAAPARLAACPLIVLSSAALPCMRAQPSRSDLENVSCGLGG